MPFDIEQDSKIAHAQAIRGLGFVQAFDISVQSVFQPFNLAKNLSACMCRQAVKVIQSRSPIFDLVAIAVHVRTFMVYAIRLGISTLIAA